MGPEFHRVVSPRVTASRSLVRLSANAVRPGRPSARTAAIQAGTSWPRSLVSISPKARTWPAAERSSGHCSKTALSRTWSSSVRVAGWRVSQPVTCRTVGGGGAVGPDPVGVQVAADQGVAAGKAPRADLAVELGGVAAALLPALLQVRLERVQLAGARLAPLAVDQFLPGDRAGIPLHGVTTPAKVPSDGAQTMPLGEQAVHQRMVASGALGEPPHRRCLLSGRRRSRLLGLLGCGRAQAVAVAGNAALGRLGQVLPQVEPVGDLHGVGGAQAGAFGVGSRAVSADDLHAGVAGQPLGQRRGLAAGEQFDRCAGLAVGQPRAVALATLDREVVHAENPRVAAGGSGSAMSSRSRLERLVVALSALVSRAPARPARATAMASSIAVNPGVRRW